MPANCIADTLHFRVSDVGLCACGRMSTQTGNIETLIITLSLVNEEQCTVDGQVKGLKTKGCEIHEANAPVYHCTADLQVVWFF